MSQLAPHSPACKERRHVGMHVSPLTQIKHVLGQCNTFGASVLLSKEHKEDDFIRVFAVAKHVCWEMFWKAREEF